jgi:ABC-type bacteriocin/lantibiotic exporter with double-glycine peptidase domain
MTSTSSASPPRRARTIRFIRQTAAADCGHACVSMLLASIGVDMPMLALCARYPVGQRGMSAKEMMDLLRMCGAKPRALRANEGSIEALRSLGAPAIVHFRDEHFAVVSAVDDHAVTVLDPAVGSRRYEHAAFRERWSGTFICAELAPGHVPTRRRSPLLSLAKEFIREDGRLWALVVGVALLVTAASVSIPWVLSRAVMMASESGRGAEQMFGLTLAMISATMLFAFWLRARVGLLIQLRLERRLASRFFDRLMRLPTRVFAMLPTGDLISRVNAVNGVRDFLSSRLGSLVLDLCVISATLGVSWYYSPQITLVFLALSLAVGVVLAVFWTRYRDLVEREILAQAEYNATLAETLNGGIEVKVNRKETVFVGRMVDSLVRYQGRLQRRGEQAAVFDAVYAFQERIVPVIAVMTPLLAIPGLQQPPITLFICYFLLTMCGPAMRSLQSFCMQLVMVRVNADRIESVQGLLDLNETEAAEAATQAPHEGAARIDVDAIAFSYLGTGAPVINGFSAHFEDSRMNVVVGASGGGKSTLLKLIAGLLVPDRGRIVIRVPGAPPQSAHAATAAYLSQHPVVFAGTVTENISLFDSAPDSARIARCARAACIHDEISALPLGYNTPLVADGRSISAGQAQRIALARLLYGAPAIMLLDEFTSDIDAETERRMVKNLREWPGMKIVVTHRTSWIAPQDRVFTLQADADLRRADDTPV